MQLFTSGKTKVVVATDAIGMGLNLPVRRIVFVQTQKFDGTTRRGLTVPEVKQIAGAPDASDSLTPATSTRWGRNPLIISGNSLLRRKNQSKKSASLSHRFSFDLDEPLDVITKVWKPLSRRLPFEKDSVDEILSLYAQAERHRDDIYGFDDKRILYRMISCPIDIKDHQVVLQWLRYCKDYPADKRLKHPDKGAGSKLGLQKYETYYRKLDLYYQFSHRFDKIIDEDWLEQERSRTEGTIMQYLSKGKKSYIARCQRCGRMLPVGYPFKICDPCFHHGSIID